MPAITDSVQFVKGIGPKKVKLFEKLHISTLQDALETYPRDYEDRTHITRIADIADEDRYAVRAIRHRAEGQPHPQGHDARQMHDL